MIVEKIIIKCERVNEGRIDWIATALPVLVLFIVYSVRNAREASIVFRIPISSINCFLSVSPVISDAIIAACPVPRAGRKEHKGETRIEEIEAGTIPFNSISFNFIDF